jgi:hypothetical protein
MRGAIHILPNTLSWRGAQFKKKSTGTTLPLPYGLKACYFDLHMDCYGRII